MGTKWEVTGFIQHFEFCILYFKLGFKICLMESINESSFAQILPLIIIFTFISLRKF